LFIYKSDIECTGVVCTRGIVSEFQYTPSAVASVFKAMHRNWPICCCQLKLVSEGLHSMMVNDCIYSSAKSWEMQMWENIK
jgi:hypothetical protein